MELIMRVITESITISALNELAESPFSVDYSLSFGGASNTVVISSSSACCTRFITIDATIV
jgi:hypothetical protein